MRHARGLDSYRECFHDEAPKGAIGNLLYSAVIESRLHGVVPRLRHTRRQTCRRLLQYLESCDASLLPEVQNIYFGHTHVPMLDYRFDRFGFHNTGSGIRYLTLKPAFFRVT
jgi:UDP-2,3-diacylglucosamine hydrolase